MNQQIDFIKYDVDEQEQTITYSCASDTPYTRWDEEKKVAYDEVLVISEDSVDMSRLKAGANVLYGHDTMCIIGVVEDAYIIENKLFVKVRFSKNDPFAVRIYRDILDGIIKNVSIGYQVLAYRDEREGGRIVRYVTRFQIFETSIVSVPADETVGVRSLKLKEHKMKKSKKDEDVKPEAEEQEVKEAAEAAEDEKKELCPECGKDPCECKKKEAETEEEKKEAVEDTDVKEGEAADEKEEKCDEPKAKSAEVDALKREVEALKAQVKALTPPVDAEAKEEEAAEIRASGAALGVPEEEQEKAIKSGMTARDFKRKYREFNNLTIKQEERHMKLKDYFREGNFNEKFMLRTYDGFGGQNGEGGASAIGTETRPLVEALEKVMGVKGYRTMTGLTSNISIPVQTGRNTIYQTEHLRDAATASAPTLTPVTLSPVKLSGNTRIGKELLVQANDDIEAFVVDSLTKEIAYKVEDYLLGKVKTGAAGSVTYSALSAIDWDDVLAFEAQVGGFALQTPAYVMSPAARAALKGIPKTENFPEFLCSGYNEINGYAVNVSGVVGNDDIYFGDWSKLLLGIWGEGLEIMVNPYTYAKEGDVEIVASLCIDAAVLQGDAFVVGAVEEESSSSN